MNWARRFCSFSPLLSPHCSLHSFTHCALVATLICSLAALISSLAALICSLAALICSLTALTPLLAVEIIGKRSVYELQHRFHTVSVHCGGYGGWHMDILTKMDSFTHQAVKLPVTKADSNCFQKQSNEPWDFCAWKWIPQAKTRTRLKNLNERSKELTSSEIQIWLFSLGKIWLGKNFREKHKKFHIFKISAFFLPPFSPPL